MKNNIFSFERLHIWQLSRSLVKDIYFTTGKFPVEERFGLVTQLRRASISVSSNIAEGSTRFSKNDQSYLIERAYGSLTEVVNQIILSGDLNFCPIADVDKYRTQIRDLSYKVNAYYNAIKFGR